MLQWLGDESTADADLTVWREALMRLGVEEHDDIAYLVEDKDLATMGMPAAQQALFKAAQLRLEQKLDAGDD